MKHSLISITIAFAALLSACGSAPREQFFAFDPPLVQGNANGPQLVLRQISVPELLQRPQMVLRQGNQITVLEQQRWAEPLEAGIAQYLRARLQSQLPGWQVITRAQQTRRDAAWEVQLDVQNLDLIATKGVQLQAQLRLQGPDGKTDSSLHSLAAACAGCDSAQLVAAQQGLLDQVAQQIVQRLPDSGKNAAR